jgi:hypothetical protein
LFKRQDKEIVLVARESIKSMKEKNVQGKETFLSIAYVSHYTNTDRARPLANKKIMFD